MRSENSSPFFKKFTASAALSFLLVSSLSGLLAGLSVVSGMIAGSINFILLKKLSYTVFFQTKYFFRLIALLLLKFPIFYFLIYLVLTYYPLSLLYFFIGTALILPLFIQYHLQTKTIVNLLVISLFFLSYPLEASIAKETFAVPNLVTLIYKSLSDVPFIIYLHFYENLLFSGLVVLFLSLFFYLGVKPKKLIPSGLQNALEYLVENLQKLIIEVLGEKGLVFLPLLGTLFVYILTMNWFTLVPLLKPPTANLNTTAALALYIFCLVQYLNLKNWGVFGFLYHMAGSPKNLVGWLLVPLMLPIELLTQVTRPLTLALRLFGNILGEDILIGAAAFFGVYLLSSLNLSGGLPIQLPFMFLALLTGLMQALVFTLLSAIYILLSMPDQGDRPENFS